MQNAENHFPRTQSNQDDDDDDLAFIRSRSPLAYNDDDDDDDYPVGDIIPQTSSNSNERIYHDGNYYEPTHTSNDYDIYEIQEVRQPFYDSTTNKEEYYWKDPNPRVHEDDDEDDETPRDRILPPFTGETTNKTTYLPHIPIKDEKKV
uniref:Uncharacterized protein n=1 Tax=Panagrolaimus superbus TaxID=310955 RepID=A0A914YGT6_9BILA